MNFDQMMEAWKAQDQKPIYGVNGDLLRLVLQHEQGDIRRALRWELWVACITSAGMAAFAGFWLWASLLNGAPLLHIVMACASIGAAALWIGAFWLSRRRQAQRERNFGNTLQAEVRRNLSLVEYQLTNGRWGTAMLWSTPVLVSALSLYWLMAEINDNTDLWFDVGMIVFVVVFTVWTTYATSGELRRKLEPRRERLSELRDMLDASE